MIRHFARYTNGCVCQRSSEIRFDLCPSECSSHERLRPVPCGFRIPLAPHHHWTSPLLEKSKPLVRSVSKDFAFLLVFRSP